MTKVLSSKVARIAASAATVAGLVAMATGASPEVADTIWTLADAICQMADDFSEV